MTLLKNKNIAIIFGIAGARIKEELYYMIYIQNQMHSYDTHIYYNYLKFYKTLFTTTRKCVVMHNGKVTNQGVGKNKIGS